MPITKNTGRQTVLSAKVDFAFGDLTDATAVDAIDLPIGAIVVGGQLNISTVFNSLTSDTIAVGDGTTTYLTATDVTALGSTEFTGLSGTGAPYTAITPIQVTWDGTGTAPTTGAGSLIVNYIMDERATETID